MPTTQVEFDHRNKSLHGVIDRGHGKERVGVGHKARLVSIQHSTPHSPDRSWAGSTWDLLGDALQHGPRLENERRQHDSTQVGARSELGNDVRQDWAG